MKRLLANVLLRVILQSAAAFLAGALPAAGAAETELDLSRPDARTAADAHPDRIGGKPANGNPLWGVSLEDLSATRERPIFSPSRRPPAVAEPVASFEPPAPPPPAEPERPALNLVGTVTGDQDKIAVFMSPSGGDPVRLHIGEAKDGWELRSVDARASALVKDGREVTLTLPAPVLGPAAAGGPSPPDGPPSGFPPALPAPGLDLHPAQPLPSPPPLKYGG